MAKKNKSPQSDNSDPIKAKTERQQELINAIYKHQMTVTIGYPGTGKTFLPASLAADAFIKCKINKIILTRPNVASGPSLGYRPGTTYEKLEEWFAEILKIIGERIGFDTMYQSIQLGTIQMVPFETMRGQNFNDCFVLLDEAQNTTSDQMKMFVTRIGNAKVCVNGDILQSDLKNKSGLRTVIDIIKTYGMDVPVIEFQEDDIVRGELCKQWILNFMDYEKR